MPRVATAASELTIYQRSAPWILPKADRTYPEWERRVFERFPPRVGASRLGLFTVFEVGTYGFTGQHWVLRPFAALADSYRKRELPDPELRALATPELRDRLQAGPVHERVVRDAPPRRTSSSSAARPSG